MTRLSTTKSPRFVSAENLNDFCCSLYSCWLTAQCVPGRGVEPIIQACSQITVQADVVANTVATMRRSNQRLQMIDKFVNDCFRGNKRKVQPRKCRLQFCIFKRKHKIVDMGQDVVNALGDNYNEVAQALVRAHKLKVYDVLDKRIPAEQAVPLCCTGTKSSKGIKLQLRDYKFRNSPDYYNQCVECAKSLPPESPAAVPSGSHVTTPPAPAASGQEPTRKATAPRHVSTRIQATEVDVPDSPAAYSPCSSGLTPVLPMRRYPRREQPLPALPNSFRNLFWPISVEESGVLMRKHRSLKLELLCQDTRVWKINNFLTKSEVGEVMRVGEQQGFESSYTQKNDGSNVYDENRTSSFSLLVGAENALVRRVQKRASEILG